MTKKNGPGSLGALGPFLLRPNTFVIIRHQVADAYSPSNAGNCGTPHNPQITYDRCENGRCLLKSDVVRRRALRHVRSRRSVIPSDQGSRVASISCDVQRGQHRAALLLHGAFSFCGFVRLAHLARAALGAISRGSYAACSSSTGNTSKTKLPRSCSVFSGRMMSK